MLHSQVACLGYIYYTWVTKKHSLPVQGMHQQNNLLFPEQQGVVCRRERTTLRISTQSIALLVSAPILQPMSVVFPSTLKSKFLGI